MESEKKKGIEDRKKKKVSKTGRIHPGTSSVAGREKNATKGIEIKIKIGSELRC